MANFHMLYSVRESMSRTNSSDRTAVEYQEVAVKSTSTVLSVGLTLLLCLALVVWNRSNSLNEVQTKFWNSHPTSGLRNEWLAWTWVTLRSVFWSRTMVDDGYVKVLIALKLYCLVTYEPVKYSQQNKIFAAPSIDRGAFVVVPPAQLKQIYGLPETKLDVHASQYETIQAKYTVGDPRVYGNPFHVNVIRNQITRNLDYLTPGIVEELALGFEKHWGNSTEWKAVPAWPSCLQIVAESVNRVFLGAPECMSSTFPLHKWRT